MRRQPPNGENALTLRMFASEGDLLCGNACDFQLKPSTFGLSNDFFDFNKISSTFGFLYLVTDDRTFTHKRDGAEVIRFSLDNLDDGDCSAGFHAWHVTDEDSLAPVQNAASTMFLAAHEHESRMETSSGSTRSPTARAR